MVYFSYYYGSELNKMITGLIPTLLIIFIFCIVLSIQVIRQKIVGIRFIGLFLGYT